MNVKVMSSMNMNKMMRPQIHILLDYTDSKLIPYRYEKELMLSL